MPYAYNVDDFEEACIFPPATLFFLEDRS